ncbi:ubiquitin carboxyl-terminal hydrolase 37-like isoform X5 [Xyrichtys novacula]|uniref:Ubiquitin carboxyl-terminal hydrolase n=1 Tax=Xyrichtys novacula TaxID=13765 RepID=A0AAV1FAB2_XYRNO|nr:ubiquitin carboxyl-terminal hydrolase 37-like isoform X5 [Xyrichtys novacula]
MANLPKERGPTLPFSHGYHSWVLHCTSGHNNVALSISSYLIAQAVVAKKSQPIPVKGEAPRIACSSFNRSTDEVSQSRVPQSEPRVAYHQVNLGFPNPAQNCYMNSSLQSLLTLTQFVRDIRSQEEVWSLIPEAQLMSVTVLEASNTENCNPQLSWLRRLFGQPLRKVSPTEREYISHQQRNLASDGLAGSTAPPPGEKNNQPKEKKWSCRFFKCCSRKKRVTPLSDHEDQQKPLQKLQRSLVKEKSHQAGDSILVLEDFREDEEEKPHQQEKKLTVPFAQQTVIASSAKEKANVEDNTDEVSQRRLSQWEQRLTCRQVSLGFPNPAQNCYMNSSLQSLLTLTQFVRDIRSQEEVWSLIPEAQLMSYFMDIACLRDVGDMRRKLEALCEFKRLLSVKAPEFVDNHQKDAHEFLIAVLGQMRDLAAPLRQVAYILGRSYRCPVERNLVFKMQNTRKCKRCGSPSVREEEFLNLSLDLIPGGSVQQMLQEFEKETDIEFNCECGDTTSAQCSTFTTLPNFLVLQLKRFNFTESYELVKCHDPVDLTRELIVTSSQAKSWYSLVSVISHLGSEGNAGHYISSGLHPDMDPETAGINKPGGWEPERTCDDTCGLYPNLILVGRADL